jgi:hypothetical protein
VDGSLSRRVRSREHVGSEFRFEATNLLNHNNYVDVTNVYGEAAQPVSTFLSPIAGVANTDPSRQMRFAVRILF